jgi:hypothetical protein
MSEVIVAVTDSIQPPVAVIQAQAVVALTHTTTMVTQVAERGLQGPMGPPGPPGVAGYVHNQLTPDVLWSVQHDLGYYPNVRVQDSAGSDIEGDITYVSANLLTVEFTAAFGGHAYLS